MPPEPSPIACATSGKTSWSQLTSLAPRKRATIAAKIENIGGSVLATMVSPRRARRQSFQVAER